VLELTAKELPLRADQAPRNVDLVVVLDRSGSMNGQKLDDARKALRHLLDQLTAKDRLSLVVYSDHVHTLSPLVPVDGVHRERLAAAISQVQADGGTNLGAGLAQGIKTLLGTPASNRHGKVILISDGLANQGITDPHALGNMASEAYENRFQVSTVGVGLGFNELLMTTLADHGGGQYYFLEEPQIMAQVFEQEFQRARQVAASAIEIHIPLQNGVRLVNAGGYPIQQMDGRAVIRPGDLLSGQNRKLFLTFQVPAHKEQTIRLDAFKVAYQHNGRDYTTRSPRPLKIACVADPNEVMASIDGDAWSNQIILEDFGQLKEEVAQALRQGDKKIAQERIREYETRTRAINVHVGSSAVAKNLDEEVDDLRREVKDTFSGPPAAVAAKQKQKAKKLQYEGYLQRRNK
jgi:Ca-activated chloride channel family protein